ncbi:MAG: hypothetical protein IE927_03145 [Rhodobacterales bacterium]|nr:hypothetical protein [Rhodobacterales bacterium]
MVDADLRILWVGRQWDEFALENGGSKAVANAVLSKPLDQYIAGEAVRQAIRAMIRAVVTHHHELSIDYRFDSPDVMRRFRLTVQPMQGDRVLMVHDLRDAQTFATPHLLQHHDETAAVAKCAFCCAMRAPGGSWTPVETWPSPHPDTVRPTICPTCEERIEGALDAARVGRKPGKPIVGGFGP